MFDLSAVIANRFLENSVSEDLDKPTSTDVFKQLEKEGRVDGFSHSDSEPDRLPEFPATAFVKSPFKLKRKESKTSKRTENMEASDPPTPNVSDTAVTESERVPPTIVGILERPVALSARLR